MTSSPRPSPRSDSQTEQIHQQQIAAARPKERDIPILSTTSAAQDQVDKRSTEQNASAPQLTGVNPEVDRLEQQLASLEATLEDQNRAYADRSRVRRLSSVSTKRAVDGCTARSRSTAMPWSIPFCA